MEPSGLHLKLKEQFCTTANELTQLFTYSMSLEKHARVRGAKDAYGEMLEWLLGHGQGELKNVPMSSLIPLLEANIQKSGRLEYNYPESKSSSHGEGGQMEALSANGDHGTSSSEGSSESVQRQGVREAWHDCTMLESETATRPLLICRKRNPHS